MKKLVSLLLSVVLLCNLGVTFLAAGPSYGISGKTAEVGEEFSLDVSISGNPGIISLRLQIVYDASVLQLVSVSNSGLLNGYTNPSPTISSPYTLRWTDALATGNNTANGTVATLTFKALKAETTTVSIQHTEARNFEGTKVSFSGASARVTVNAKPVPATGVTIDRALSLKTGEIKTPNFEVLPADATNKAVSFTSSNPSVATVHPTTGAVTGIKEGSAVITVKTDDGNFTAECLVTVECSHANKTAVAAKASDCKNAGWDAYVKCNDCGRLFAADGVTEISEIPYLPLSNNHTEGTPATCTAPAVCSVCGQSYGDVIPHNYNSAIKNEGTLKTAGTCRDAAVYYYSCSGCGAVEKNDNHTFRGETDPENHVGGTETVNASEADHKTQTPGNTGDTRCLECGEIITRGQTISPTPHVPVWQNDANGHWQICNVNGCGIIIDGSRGQHSSTGENVATCQHAAKCDVCGVTYGNPVPHSYTSEIKSADTLKTAGDCANAAVYYYSCSGCGAVEKNDNHTFTGEKDPTKHVGGTETVNASEADHKTQTPGYTGDVKCLGCGEIITYGQTIAPTPHVPVWQNDADNHWQICTVNGCGVEIEGSRAQHSSTGANAADCQHVAKCDKCGVSYGELGDHNWSALWYDDEAGHWRECTNEGCSEKTTSESHTPDRIGGATEDYPIKCTTCHRIIEEQLAHPHVYDQEVATDAYKITDATCSAKATYYKSCRCGDKGTEIFESGEFAEHAFADATCTLPKTCTACGATEGEPNGHTAGGEWQKDESSHWKLCTVAGCGAIVEETKAAHNPDHEGGATEEYPIRCTECLYIIEAQLAHPHVYNQEVATSEYKATDATCTAKATYYKSCRCGDKGTETFEHGDLAEHVWAEATCTLPKTCTACGATEGIANGHTASGEWKFDKDNHWQTCAVEGCGAVIEETVTAHTPDKDQPTETESVNCSVCGYMITPELSHVHSYGSEWKSDENNHWNECVCGDISGTAAHVDENKDGSCDTCGHEVEVSEPDVEEPAEQNNFLIWIIIAVIAVLALVVIVIIVTRKKKSA